MICLPDLLWGITITYGWVYGELCMRGSQLRPSDKVQMGLDMGESPGSEAGRQWPQVMRGAHKPQVQEWLWEEWGEKGSKGPERPGTRQQGWRGGGMRVFGGKWGGRRGLVRASVPVRWHPHGPRNSSDTEKGEPENILSNPQNEVISNREKCSVLSRTEARACCAPIWGQSSCRPAGPVELRNWEALHTRSEPKAALLLGWRWTGASPAHPLDGGFHQDTGPGGRQEDLGPVLQYEHNQISADPHSKTILGCSWLVDSTLSPDSFHGKNHFLKK